MDKSIAGSNPVWLVVIVVVEVVVMKLKGGGRSVLIGEKERMSTRGKNGFKR